MSATLSLFFQTDMAHGATAAASMADWVNALPVHVIIAWAAALLILVFNKQAARLFATLMVARKQRAFEHQARLARTKLVPGIGWLLAALAVYAAWALTPPLPRFNTFIGKVVTSALIAGVFYLLYKITGLTWFWMKSEKEHEQPVRRSARHYLSAALRIVVLIIGVLALLSVWVKNIAGIIAGLGIGGLAVALAAQDTLANFFGSLALMFDHPFVLGDYIQTTEMEGTVMRVGLRSSRVRRPDQTIVYVPNKTLAAAAIANLSQRTARRVESTFYLALQNDPDAVTAFMQALSQSIRADGQTINQDETVVDILHFTERSIAIRMRFFTPPDYSIMLQVSGRINALALALAADHRLTLSVLADAGANGSAAGQQRSP